MAGSKKPLVSIIIVTFNSQKYIKDCLRKVLASDYLNFEVIIVDNNSTDKTVQIIKQNFPNVRVVKRATNLGYAEGNNLGVEKARGDYVAILNPDTQVSQGWLKPLLVGIKKSKVAACQPKIMLKNQKSQINLTGKTTHFLGFDWLENYQKKDYKMSTREINSFSGSAILINKRIFKKLGGFDSLFFMYYEDGDLSWRIRLAGYKIILVPDSIVYHDYKYQTDENYQKMKRKFYYLERNRLIMIFKNYSLRTFFLLLPAFVLMETGMNVYFLGKGWLIEKWKGYFWILGNLPEILRKRYFIQKRRQFSDCEVCRGFAGTIEFKEFNNVFVKWIANPVLSVYWRGVKKLI